jgi:hypothetical protein
MSNPINGIVGSIRCYHCGEVNRLEQAFWTWFLHDDLFERAFQPPVEEKRSGRIQPVCWVFYRPRMPRCRRCDGPEIDPDALVGAASCFCPGCGAAIPVRAADDLCRAIHKGARVVVGESTSPAEQAVQARTTPMLFACMGCGGALTVDGSTQAVTCTFCNAPNYLPDGLWNQLHPVPRPHDFYFVYAP